MINTDQVMMNIVESTQSTVLDFSYKSLQMNEDLILDSLVEAIYQISKMVPNGILIVCPSYRILNRLRFKIK